MSDVWPTFLATYRVKIVARWRQLAAELLQDWREYPGVRPIEPILESYFNNPGKLLRPSLFLGGYELDGQPLSKSILDLSLSFEFLHLALLVQDDIIDRGRWRRGQPTLHRALEGYHRQANLAGQSSAYGRNTAMLISNLLIAAADSLWTRAVTEATVTPALRAHFDQLKHEVYLGEYLDLTLASRPGPPSRADIERVMIEKSGYYTIYRPLEIGALAGGGNKTDLRWLEPFAVNAGLAFQAVDDYLGVFGQAKQLGKSVTSDLKERKATLVMYFAWRLANTSEKTKLDRYYRREKTVSLRTINQLVRQEKVAAAVERAIASYRQQSLAALRTSRLTKRQKTQLEELVHFLVIRRA